MSKKITHDEFINKLAELNVYVKSGKMKVLSTYEDSHTPIECMCLVHNYIWYTNASNLYRGSGCKKCGVEERARKKAISSNEFLNKLHDCNCGVSMVGTYVNMTTPSTFMCSNGHTWDAMPYKIINGTYCPYCTNKKILIGFNDLWTTSPETAGLLSNKEDGYRFTNGSGQKAAFICPLCGKLQTKIIRNVVRRGLQCSFCSDSISFPNKFGRAFLDQLPIDCYITEYSPRWLKPYFYDNYFKYDGKEYILEMDGGLGHGNIDFTSKNKDTKGKERDDIKDKLARENGLIVIRIDSVRSDYKYIKNNILTSCLADIFDLSTINWEKCDMQAQKNLIKEVCNLYMSGIHSTINIGHILHLNSCTVCRYLKRGAEYGWCDYDSKQRKSVDLLDDNLNLIRRFSNMDECAEYLNVEYGIASNKTSMFVCCKEERQYKGFNLRYANSTTQN